MKILNILALNALLITTVQSQSCVEPRVELTGRGHRDTTGTSISFDMKYFGCKALVVKKSSLPWGWAGSLSLTANIRNKNNTKLTKLGYISDPGVDDVKIYPGKTYKGSLGLTGIFRDVDSGIDTHGVDVHWTYVLKANNGTIFPSVEGSAFIGKHVK